MMRQCSISRCNPIFFNHCRRRLYSRRHLLNRRNLPNSRHLRNSRRLKSIAMQTNPLDLPSESQFRPGCSLKYAYQPDTEGAIQIYFNQHPCQACGEVSSDATVPIVEVLRAGSILFKILPKRCFCGYENEMLVILNDVIRHDDLAMLPAADAIAQAEAMQQLPSAAVNEQLIAAQVAIHHQRYDDAIAINQTLANQYPTLFLPSYNLGVLYSQQGQYEKSVAAYDNALALMPTHAESLAGKAFALLKGGHLSQSGMAYEQWRQQNSEGTVILAKTEGLFGSVQIVDTPDSRSLCLGEQVQGTVCQQPTAAEFEPTCRLGPGPLSPNRFAAGFLLLGYAMRRSHGLVIGLGGAASVVMNLACFPEMSLTVVEIDPVVIKLCLTFFPLVQHYIDQGRLTIIETDALDFLQTNRQSFDFVQFDAYQGSPDVPAPFRSVEVIRQMGAIAPILFSNIIGKLTDPAFHQVLAIFDQAGCPMHTLYPSESIEGKESTHLNWIGSTYPLSIPDDFVPFAHLSGSAVEALWQNFNLLKDRAVLRSHLAEKGGVRASF